MKGLYALIMAGGSGTRFWPVSREMWPKQMLKIVGDESMISQTIKRVRGLVDRGNTYIITTKSQASDLRFCVDEGDRSAVSLIKEPCAKNTAPAIGLAAIYIKKLSPESIMLILPADHYIKDKDAFLEAVGRAVEGAYDGGLVTIGIKPARPDTGYGYIKCGTAVAEDIYRVEGFKEKPDILKAREYLKSGDYYWNSGIFVWKAEAILGEIKSRLPSLWKGLKKIETAIGSKREQSVIDAVYSGFESISVDYGVLEKSRNILMVEGRFGWSDVGSWSALDELLTKDASGNIIKGDANIIDIGSRNSTIFAEDRVVATIGLEGMVVVDTPDATLVCPKERCQDVKMVVNELKRRGRDEHVAHRRVERPWGSYMVLENGDGYKIKRISIKPGGRLSLQLHKRRSEHWVIVAGKATVTRGEETFELKRNESAYIPISVTHRLENLGEEELQIIEVQNGDYLEEDDIVRIEDVYGR